MILILSLSQCAVEAENRREIDHESRYALLVFVGQRAHVAGRKPIGG
jgi:hypothetical protein